MHILYYSSLKQVGKRDNFKTLHMNIYAMEVKCFFFFFFFFFLFVCLFVFFTIFPSYSILGHEPDMVYLPQGGVLYTIIFLKPSVLEVFCSMLALWRLGRYAVTACYKRYPSKIYYKIKINEIYLKNQSQFHMFKILIDSVRTIQ